MRCTKNRLSEGRGSFRRVSEESNSSRIVGLLREFPKGANERFCLIWMLSFRKQSLRRWWVSAKQASAGA